MDVEKTLKAYIASQASIRETDHLFIVLGGARKDKMASVRLIVSWMIKTNSLACQANRLPITEGHNAHSTRDIAISWAAVGHVSLETICKAASWSSMQNFICHYIKPTLKVKGIFSFFGFFIWKQVLSLENFSCIALPVKTLLISNHFLFCCECKDRRSIKTCFHCIRTLPIQTIFLG